MQPSESQRIENEEKDIHNPTPEEAEYETSPDAPYNRHTQRHLGNRTNDCEAEVQRSKQYYHGE